VRRADNLRSLNLLEPSGPVQACNGVALPFIINKQSETLLRATRIYVTHFGSKDHYVVTKSSVDLGTQFCYLTIPSFSPDTSEILNSLYRVDMSFAFKFPAG